LVTSGIWNVASACVFSTIWALPRFGFCVVTEPPWAMLFAVRVGGIGTFTVSPAWARVGSKLRFTRFPMTRLPIKAGSASAATSFTIALATFEEVIAGILLSHKSCGPELAPGRLVV